MSKPGETPTNARTPPAFPAGRVLLTARWSVSRRQVTGVAADARRPEAERLFVGKTPEQATKLVPLIYSLCGKAQADVAEAALGAAVAGHAWPVEAAAAEREAVAEHLWRLVIDWPDNLQKKPDRAAFAQWRRALHAGELSMEQFGEFFMFVSRVVLERVDEMADVLAREDPLRPPSPTVLPVVGLRNLAALFGDADAAFARRPTWQGRPAETGTTVGDWSPTSSLADRLRARGQELQRRTMALFGEPPPPIIGVPLPGSGGIACFNTARGLLIHRVQVEGGVIRSYAVVAPTEWNFHPESTWISALAGLPAESPEIAHNALRRWVLALDPCVPARIEIIEED